MRETKEESEDEEFRVLVWAGDDYPLPNTVKDDILRTQNICEEITLEKVHAIKAPVRILRTLLRAFAPLM